MKRLWLVVAMAGMLTGCMHRNMVVMDMPPDSIAQVNREIAGKSGLVRLQSNEIVEGRDFQVDRDFTQWTQNGDSVRVMPNLELNRITIPDPRTGILRATKNGPWIGTLTGILMGPLFWTVSPAPLKRISDIGGPGKGPVANWVIGGALMGLTGGTVISLFIGSGYCIRIEFAPPHGR